MKIYKQLPQQVQAVLFGGDNPGDVEKLLEVPVSQNPNTRTLFCKLPEGEAVVPTGFWVCIGQDAKVYILSDNDFMRVYYRAWDQK